MKISQNGVVAENYIIKAHPFLFVVRGCFCPTPGEQSSSDRDCEAVKDWSIDLILSRKSLQTFDPGLFNFWGSAVWLCTSLANTKAHSYLYAKNAEERNIGFVTKFGTYIRRLISSLKMYHYTILQRKWRSVRLSHLPKVVEVGFGLKSDSWTPYSFYCGVIPSSCPLLPFPFRAEFWLVLGREDSEYWERS